MNTNRRGACCRAPQRAYLVRCWREEGDVAGGATHWRFSAEEVLTRQPRRGFDNLQAVYLYLQVELAESEDEGEEGGGHEGRRMKGWNSERL